MELRVARLRSNDRMMLRLGVIVFLVGLLEAYLTKCSVVHVATCLLFYIPR